MLLVHLYFKAEKVARLQENLAIIQVYAGVERKEGRTHRRTDGRTRFATLITLSAALPSFLPVH